MTKIIKLTHETGRDADGRKRKIGGDFLSPLLKRVLPNILLKFKW